ncbi:MAG: Alpha-L-fucosidase [bacterium ADurb.Bin429]|nr:MAG: Alpha-L-fucosidase [bacterium ADurb.Bin429]
MVRALHVMSLFLCTVATLAADTPPAGKAERPWVQDTASAVARWQAMRFGLFVHWGPASLTGNEISWSRGGTTSGMMPAEAYDQLYQRFNPTRFDADAWAKTAKAAGMKYLVITAKHADGFCLWPSQFTDYTISKTPFKRDIIKELSMACKRHGIQFCVYYCITDWYHPDYPLGSPGGRSEKPNPNMPRYLEFVKHQTEELITKYGPLGLLWFDIGDRAVWFSEYRQYGDDLYTFVKTLQPSLVVNDRCVQSVPPSGDYATWEGKIGPFNRERPWETCTVIGGHWAWTGSAATEVGIMSLRECVRMLLRVAGNDGNFLLNVGPRADGCIEPVQVQRLKEMGDWLKQYGEGVYGTRGGPFKAGRWGASTCKGNTIYLFPMKWPRQGPLILPPIAAKITNTRALTGGKAVVTQNEAGTFVSLAADYRPPIVAVIKLTVDRKALEIPPVDVVTFTSRDPKMQQLKDLTRGASYTISSNIDPSWKAETSGLLEDNGRNAGFAFHTRKGPDQHLIIDLKHTAAIQRIEIINRRDACQDRARTLTVWVAGDGAGEAPTTWQELWRAEQSDADWIIELDDRDINSRFVKIGLREDEYFHLSSVRVYGP